MMKPKKRKKTTRKQMKKDEKHHDERKLNSMKSEDQAEKKMKVESAAMTN